MSDRELQQELTELKRSVVRTVLLKRGLQIRKETLAQISLETPYSEYGADAIQFRNLRFRSYPRRFMQLVTHLLPRGDRTSGKR